MSENKIGYRYEGNLTVKFLMSGGLLVLISSGLLHLYYPGLGDLLLSFSFTIMGIGLILRHFAPKYRNVCDKSLGKPKYYMEAYKNGQWIKVYSKNKWW